VTAFSGISIISDIIGHKDTKTRRRKMGYLPRAFVSSWPINAADYPDAAESRLSTLLFG
jgi:hypothetical protein